MDKIWERRPDEDDRQHKAFLLFCEGYSFRKICKEVGIGSTSTISKLKETKDWDNRRAEYEAYKAAEGISDSATTIPEDLVLAASHSRLLAFKAENDTGETFNLSTETAEQENAVDGTFDEQNKTAVIFDSTTLLPITSLTSPSRSLEQLAADFNFKVRQGDSCIKKGLIYFLDAGKDLNLAKTLVNHGDWENWLTAKSKYPIRRAQKLMQLADKFGYLTDHPEIVEKVSVSQMLELLSLPEGEEQNFFDKLTAEGKTLADMTQKETRAEVKDYNAEMAKLQKEVDAARADADKEKQRADSLQGQLDLFDDKLKTAESETQATRQELQAAQKTIETQSVENTTLQGRIKALEEKPPVTVEVEKKVIPADYESNKQTVKDQNKRILDLQSQVDSATVNVYAAKQKIAEMESRQADAVKRAEVFAKLNTISDLLVGLDDSAHNFIQEYATENPQKFQQICKYLLIDNNQ